jgi:hypothetical protein
VDKYVEVPVQKQVQVPMVSVVQKLVDVPQVEFVDNHVHIPIQKHRHVPTITKVQKPVEITVIETIEKIVDVPVVKQIEVPQIQTIEKIVEIPYIQTVEKIVEVPQVGQTVEGERKVTTVQLETLRSEAPVEVVQEFVAGPPMDAVHGGSYMTAPPQYAVAPAPGGSVQVMQEPVAVPPQQ